MFAQHRAAAALHLRPHSPVVVERHGRATPRLWRRATSGKHPGDRWSTCWAVAPVMRRWAASQTSRAWPMVRRVLRGFISYLCDGFTKRNRLQGMRSPPLVLELSSCRRPPRRGCALLSSLRPPLRGCGVRARLAWFQTVLCRWQAARCHGSRRHAPLHALTPSPRQMAQLGQQCRRPPLLRPGVLLRRTLKSAPLLPSGRLRSQLRGVQKRQQKRRRQSPSFRSSSSCID